jgi:hypothetical protein
MALFLCCQLPYNRTFLKCDFKVETYLILYGPFIILQCICSPTRYAVCFVWLILFTTFASSTCFGPHGSILRSVLLQAVCADLVCGNTRTARYTMSSCHGVVGRTAFFLQHHNSCTYRLVRVLPHTKSAHTACNKTLLRTDLWGPKHVELTNVMNKLNHKKRLCILLYYIYFARWYMIHHDLRNLFKYQTARKSVK